MNTQEELFAMLDRNVRDALRELETGNSERAKVLIAFAAVDQAIVQTLKNFLADCTDTTELLNPERGAIGPFVARVKLCNALGLLPQSYCTAAKELAKIRNDFAHNLDASFQAANLAKIRKAETAMPLKPQFGEEAVQRYVGIAAELAIKIALLWSEDRLSERRHVHG